MNYSFKSIRYDEADRIYHGLFPLLKTSATIFKLVSFRAYPDII
ncbi:MAG: hypothetical protein ABIK67_06885 [candidate division WOR-3 bacterium]